MKRFILFIAASAAFSATASSLPAFAQYANEFTPAKVTHQGTTTHAIAGSGTVTVQVQVNPDGSHKVIRVIHSSNSGDNAAAMDIASTASYSPAHKGTTPVVSFYDFELRFNGKSVSQAPQESAETGSSSGIDALIRAGKYQDAIAKANADLASNPNDSQTQQLLGVAQYYAGDQAASAASFDKVSTISKSFSAVAAQAYVGASVKDSQSNNPAQALAYAQRAMQLQPDTNSRFALGVAQVANKQWSDAISNLKAVHDALPASQAKAKANVDAELMQAYLATNDTTDASSTAAEMKTLNPNGSSATHVMAVHYLQTGIDAMNAKKFADALTAFQQAAAEGTPDDAVTANVYSAFAVLRMDSPDYSKARDFALKALATKPSDPEANYAAGVAYAGIYSQSSKADDKKQALDYLNKADEYAKAAGNTALATQVETQIKNVSH